MIKREQIRDRHVFLFYFFINSNENFMVVGERQTPRTYLLYQNYVKNEVI